MTIIDANGEQLDLVAADDGPIDLASVLAFLGIDQQELETDILAMSWDNFVQLAGDRAAEVAIERYRKLHEEQES